MDFKYLNIEFLIIFILPCVVSQVYWSVSSVPAMFGQNTVLTCHLEDILTNPKDCAVRQWSGGPDHPPTGIHVLFSLEYDLLRVVLDIKRVYPVPNCSLYFNFTGVCHLQNSLTLKIVPVTYKANGFVYSVTYNASYRLSEKDCNKQPELKCTFEHVAEPMIFKGNETYECLVYESIPLLLNNATRRHDQEKVAQTTIFPAYTIALIAVALLLIIVFIFVIIVWKYRQRCQCKQKRQIQKKANDTKEKELFIE
ncbi:unnamed protein product [Mytilus edulis]|uniref:Uncharacterized protein n=1 Tax=Mytilus edulis TaxID=6550 RepID=A0A8S3U0N1_MYTED|nr:unnamed protein product [Mytilus edulis]